jgi:hypothetical protein
MVLELNPLKPIPSKCLDNFFLLKKTRTFNYNKLIFHY